MATRPRTRREDRPDIILDAAENVLRASGARALTIDAVAAQAGLSKGGVLHHFASKDVLIRTLVARKLRRIEAGIAEHEENQEPSPAAKPLAMVANARQTYGEEDGFPRALLLASAEQPEALAEFRAFMASRLAQVGELEKRPGAGSAFFFAIIGLMVGRALGLHDLSQAQAGQVFDALEQAARTLGEA